MGILFNDGTNFLVKNCYVYGGAFPEGGSPDATFCPGDVATLPSHLANDLVLANGWLELTRQGERQEGRRERREDRREDIAEAVTGKEDGGQKKGPSGPGVLTGR